MDSENLKLLAFKIEDQNFAFPLSMVERIIYAQTITLVEKVPAFIEGVIDIKGEIITIVSLRKRFSLPDKPIDISDQIIIINSSAGKVGIIADEVNDLMTVPPAGIKSIKPVFDGMEKIDLYNNSEGIFYIFDTTTIFTNIELSEIEKLKKSFQKT